MLRRLFGMHANEDNNWWCWAVIGGAFVGVSLAVWLPLLLLI
jgi:hypothetical protein